MSTYLTLFAEKLQALTATGSAEYPLEGFSVDTIKNGFAVKFNGTLCFNIINGKISTGAAEVPVNFIKPFGSDVPIVPEINEDTGRFNSIGYLFYDKWETMDSSSKTKIAAHFNGMNLDNMEILYLSGTDLIKFMLDGSTYYYECNFNENMGGSCSTVKICACVTQNKIILYHLPLIGVKTVTGCMAMYYDNCLYVCQSKGAVTVISIIDKDGKLKKVTARINGKSIVISENDPDTYYNINPNNMVFGSETFCFTGFNDLRMNIFGKGANFTEIDGLEYVYHKQIEGKWYPHLIVKSNIETVLRTEFEGSIPIKITTSNIETILYVGSKCITIPKTLLIQAQI